MSYGTLDYSIEDKALKDGNFMMPLVFEKIPKGSVAYQEELFGPVFCLFKVKDNHEAI